MNDYAKKESIQAVLLADSNVRNFRPITDQTSMALLPLVNVPLIDYALEALNRSKVEEVFIFSRLYINEVRDYIRKGIESNCTWSIDMNVKVIGAEDCRCIGDALRDLDSKGLMRGDFILLGADTVTNANLVQILEEHRKAAKFDKGAAMTIILKEAPTDIRTEDEVLIAMDVESKRLHFHQRLKQTIKEKKFTIPLEMFLINSEIIIHHNLLDPQIAICSPAMLSLFSDNFDFENRDDFIRGLLINEEVLDSRIYVSILPEGQYARKVSNWLTYQIVSNDVINRWAYPLVPDMGICSLQRNYLFLRNNVYKNETACVSKGALKENVVIQKGSIVDNGSVLSSTVIGENCKIGKNCILKNVFVFNNVIIEDDCCINYCIIGENTKILRKSVLSDGTVIGANVTIPPSSNISKLIIHASKNNTIEKLMSTESEDNSFQKLGDNAYILNELSDTNSSDSEDDDFEPDKSGPLKMMKLAHNQEESEYDSTSDENETRQCSPLADDTNIFLSEVIDSLTRGFTEKSNPDFLILEINSSRYAYNLVLKEVNFYVIKAVFSLQMVLEETNTMEIIGKIFQYLEPVVRNYIKTYDSMLDCLNAFEECCGEQRQLKAKAAQIIHFLYDKEYVSEEAILKWYEKLNGNSMSLKNSLKKLVDWLMASSEEESDE